jgi:hypothetical protein
MIFNKCLEVFQLILMCYWFPSYIYIPLPDLISDDIIMSRKNF